MNTPGPIEVHPIVKQIVDRDCQVGESYRTVVRHVVSKLRRGYSTFRELPKAERRSLMQQCIQQHRDYRQLYAAVMYPTYRPLSEEE